MHLEQQTLIPSGCDPVHQYELEAVNELQNKARVPWGVINKLQFSTLKSVINAVKKIRFKYHCDCIW